MLPKDIAPGSWSDGTKNDSDFEKRCQQEIQESKAQKNELINSSLIHGQITLEMANLLRNIQSSTAGNHEHENLLKIESILACRRKLSNLKDKPVAYIAAGTDWQFPVALGATNIDMVDMDYPALIKEMLTSIKMFDQNPLIKGNESIGFNINLGEGIKKIKLNIVGKMSNLYFPIELAGVIEALGTTKQNDGTSPVFANVAQGLHKGSFILNLDFHKVCLGDNSGLREEQSVDNSVVFYRVSDPVSLRKIAIESERNSPFNSSDMPCAFPS
jgi:hypothetical protein